MSKKNLSELSSSRLVCVKKHVCSGAGMKCGVVAISPDEMAGVEIQESSNIVFLSWIDISPVQVKSGFWGHVPMEAAKQLIAGGNAEIPKEVFYANGQPDNPKDSAETERTLAEIETEETMRPCSEFAT